MKENKPKMKKWISSITMCLLCVMGIVCCSGTKVFAETTADGFEYSTWEENETISITGYIGTASELVIPNTIDGKTVKAIGYEAFRKCDNLTSVIIPNGVMSIGQGAFRECSNLKSVTIPSSVTSINRMAFSRCSSLEAITIPNGVESIGMWAFSNCDNLTGIKIPDSVTSIDDAAFDSCNNLKSIEVASGNEVYNSKGNCNAIIETATNTLILGCSTTIIPNGITSIGESAFNNCSNLTEIIIPDGVESIGYYAFSGCNLTSITFPKSLTTIKDEAFYGCTDLTSVTFPEGVVSIGCNAFSECTDLTSITISSSVTNIASGAFSGCNKLTSIRIDEKNKVYNSKNDCNAIIETETNKLIQGCSTTIIPNGVTNIYCDAFDGCDRLTSITIPNTVVYIETSAFSNCDGLTSIIIPESVIGIGCNAFFDCDSLTSIMIPSSVTNVSSGAFSGCDNLTKIEVSGENKVYNSKNGCNAIIETETNKLIQGCSTTIIPDDVVSIGAEAFEGCKKLKNITIPESVTSVAASAFSDCDSLTRIKIPSSLKTIWIGIFYGCDNLKSVLIPSSVTHIEDDAFWECPSTMIIYTDEGSAAAEYANEHGFAVRPISEYPTEDEHVHNYAKEWTIDKEATCRETGSKSHHCMDDDCTEKTDVTEIAKNAHIWDEGKITREATVMVEGVKTYICSLCGETKTETIPKISDTDGKTPLSETINNLPAVGSIVTVSTGQYRITKSDDTGKEVTYIASLNNKKTSVTIPNTIKINNYTYKVTSVFDKAFKNNKKLKEVTIGKNVNQIGKEAFYNCKRLSKITIKSIVLKSVGKNAIKGINKKATIKVPKKKYTKYKKLFNSKTGYRKSMKIKK